MSRVEDGPRRWKIIGAIVAIVLPAVLVFASLGQVSKAVYGAVHSDFAARLHNAQGDCRLIADIVSQINAAVLDRMLVIYLMVAGLVALLGAVHRVWAHGGDSAALKSADFAGKCLALSAAVIVATAAAARLGGAGLNEYLPQLFWVTVLSALVVVVGIFFLLWNAHLKAKKKATADAQACIQAKMQARLRRRFRRGPRLSRRPKPRNV